MAGLRRNPPRRPSPRGGFRPRPASFGTGFVDQETINVCQEVIGYRFDDPNLLNLALTHASVAPTRTESNERLEFLGDAVLGLTVCEVLFRYDDELTEGDMTKIKSLVVSRQTCAEVAEETGIGELLATGKGMPSTCDLPTSVTAAVFEAIIGAVYLDGGMDAARDFIVRHIQPKIDAALDSDHHRNFKSLLQQYAQKTHGQMPQYLMLDEKGPDHSKCFEVAVSINGHIYPSAWGNSKKEAEQQAARQALVDAGQLEEA